MTFLVTVRAMDNGAKRLTEAELLAGGCRPIRAFVLPAENDPAENNDAATHDGDTDKSGPAENDKAAQTDAATGDRKPKTSSERTRKYRESLQGRQQLNLLTTVDPEKRNTLKELAKNIEIDGVHEICVMAMRAREDVKTLDAMRVAADSPDLVEFGVIASRDVVRAAVDGVIGNAELRSLVATLLADKEVYDRVAAIVRNASVLRVFGTLAENAELRACLSTMMKDPGFLALCSSIQQNRQLRQAAQAAESNQKIASITIQLSTSTPAALENLAVIIKRPEIFALGKRAAASAEVRRAVDYAIKFPSAVQLGHKISLVQGTRGRILRMLLAFFLKSGSRAG